LATVAVLEDNRSEQPSRLRRLWARPTARGLAAAAVLAAVWVCWSLIPGTPSLFAQAIKELEQAPAVHITTTIHDSHKPGQVETVDMWIIRGVALAVTHSVNAEMDWMVVDDLKTRTGWDAKTNAVSVEPSPPENSLFSTDSLYRRFADLGLLVDLERRAKDAGVQIQAETIADGERKVSRVTIGPEFRSEFRVGDVELHGTTTLVVDIDPNTRRCVRFVRTSKPFQDSSIVLPAGTRGVFVDHPPGEAAKPLSLEDIQELSRKSEPKDVGGVSVRVRSAQGVTTEQRRIDYPNPTAIDKSLFDLHAPADAQRVAYDMPARIRADELRLKNVGRAVEKFRESHDGRLPTNWDWDLGPFLDKTYSPPEPYWLADNKLELISGDAPPKNPFSSGYTNWQFFHSGERYSDLKEPDKAVMAEYRHPWGYVIRLFASGRTESTRL
jgi:hypothetical protein